MLIAAQEIANAQSGKVQCPGRYTALMLSDSATRSERTVFINISCFVKIKKQEMFKKTKVSVKHPGIRVGRAEFSSRVYTTSRSGEFIVHMKIGRVVKS